MDQEEIHASNNALIEDTASVESRKEPTREEAMAETARLIVECENIQANYKKLRGEN